MIKLAALLFGACLVGLVWAGDGPYAGLAVSKEAQKWVKILKEEPLSMPEEQLTKLLAHANKVFETSGYPSACDEYLKTSAKLRKGQCTGDLTLLLDGFTKKLAEQEAVASVIAADNLCKLTAKLLFEQQCIRTIEKNHEQVKIPAEIEELIGQFKQMYPGMELKDISLMEESSDELDKLLLTQKYSTACESYLKDVEDLDDKDKCMSEFNSLADKSFSDKLMGVDNFIEAYAAANLCELTKELQDSQEKCFKSVAKAYNKLEISGTIRSLVAIVQEELPGVSLEEIANMKELSEPLNEKLMQQEYPAAKCKDYLKKYNRAQLKARCGDKFAAELCKDKFPEKIPMFAEKNAAATLCLLVKELPIVQECLKTSVKAHEALVIPAEIRELIMHV